MTVSEWYPDLNRAAKPVTSSMSVVDDGYKLGYIVAQLRRFKIWLLIPLSVRA